ncbi:hypothetical protein FRB94_001060 [Tulasnella sp. JGI-2019a]|nr:hypothetical protein FRB94_001060 [Tulasnella sp. JGI-2019a]
MSSQEVDYRKNRNPLRELDLQIHSAFFILSILNMAMVIQLPMSFNYDAGFSLIIWLFFDIIGVVYSAVYVYTHGRPTYSPGRPGAFLVVLWGILGFRWIKALVVTIVSQASVNSKFWIAAASFHILSFAGVLSTGFGIYWRYQSDSRYISQMAPKPEVPPPSCGLKHILQLKQLFQCPQDTDASQYIITHVNWWQERGFWKHQYVIVEALVPRIGDSSTRYFRVERHKTEWLALWNTNILDHISYSTLEVDLIPNSVLVAGFGVSNPEDPAQSEYNIEMLGRLIESINKEAPSYILPSVNRWWFAGCTIERLAARLGEDRMKPYRSVSVWAREEQTYQNLIKSCYLVYFHLHWPYWVLPLWTILDLLNLIRIYAFDITQINVIFAAFVELWAIFQYIAVDRAWGHVRGRFNGSQGRKPSNATRLRQFLVQVVVLGVITARGFAGIFFHNIYLL